MKKTLLSLALLCLSIGAIHAQSPLIKSWKFNTTGNYVTDGTTNIFTDVTELWYDSSDVYIKTSGVPSYYNFKTNPTKNAASDLKATFRITRNPKQNTGTPFNTLGGGQYGLFKDGTLLFNGEDARSYNNANVWHQLAYYFEGVDFDLTWGHSTPTKQYHHHVLSLAMVDTSKKNVHSPLIGFAFDGFPVYGPYGYKNPTDTTSKIVRMTPSYQKRNITDRTTLPDGSTASQAGPKPGGMTPLGCYREDYIYVANSGYLDDHNGRFTKTREYPNGTYAYFATVDSQYKPVYPYLMGQSYYGTPSPGNMGPGGGNNTVPTGAVQFNPRTAIGDETTPITEGISIYPNPTSGIINLNIADYKTGIQVEIMDLSGRTLQKTTLNSNNTQINISSLPSGLYLLKATSQSNGLQYISKMLKN